MLIYEFLDVDIQYRIKVYSDIRYNDGLRSLQFDIGSSDIKLSPILLITDIGLSVHLWGSAMGSKIIVIFSGPSNEWQSNRYFLQ